MTDSRTFDTRAEFARYLYDQAVTAGMTGRERLRLALLAGHVARTYPDHGLDSTASTQ